MAESTRLNSAEVVGQSTSVSLCSPPHCQESLEGSLAETSAALQRRTFPFVYANSIFLLYGILSLFCGTM